MLRTLKLITLAVLCWLAVVLPWQAYAEEVLIVNSLPIKPYQQAIDGLNQVLGNTSYLEVKTIQRVESEVFYAGSIKGNNIFNRKIRDQQGQIIVAVGSKALAAVADITLPIVYLMAANPEKIIQGKTNITGVSLTVDPGKQLAAIIALLPSIKNIGIIYNPANSADQIASLESSAKKNTSLTLLTKRVALAKAVNAALAELGTSVQAVLLVPDTTVVTSANLDIFSLYSLNKNKPLIAFAPQYLKHGASLAIYSTPEAMGQQAGHMVLRLLGGKNIAEMPPETSQTITVQINQRILHKLGFETAPPM